MSLAKRVARRLHLVAAPPKSVHQPRRISLDYVEYLEGVASPELAQFARKAYEQQGAEDAKRAQRERKAMARASGGNAR
jgi:hypothetical protein